MLNNEEFRRLAMAAVQQAVEDACGGDREALTWLLATGIDWLQMCSIEVDPAQIQRACSMSWNELQKWSGIKHFSRRQQIGQSKKGKAYGWAAGDEKTPVEASKKHIAFLWPDLANDLDRIRGRSTLSLKEKEEMRNLRI